MLRVAFVDQTGSESGGAQESLALLLRHLPSWIDPTVILFHDGTFAERLRDGRFRVRIFRVPHAIDSGRRERVGLRGAAAAPVYVVRLARLLASVGADVTYTHTVKAHFIGAPAARLAGIPCVMHFRDILQGAASAALRAVATCCSRERIAISNAVARAYGLDSTRVVLNPVEPPHAVAASRAEAAAKLGVPLAEVPTLGIVGRINRWKGHDRFLRIARRISDRMEARFLIVGSAIFRDEDFVDDLRRMTADLGLATRVQFVPWLDDVTDAYSLIDLNCICSRREPFGRTCIEAAAQAVPTICFTDSGASEIIQSGVNGLVVDAEDEDAFAHAICALFASAARLRAIRDAVPRLVDLCAPANHAVAVAAVLADAVA